MRQNQNISLRLHEEEQKYFTEERVMRSHELRCPVCGATGVYELRWLLRRRREPAAAPELTSKELIRLAGRRSYAALIDHSAHCQNPLCAKVFVVSGIERIQDLPESTTESEP